MNATVWKKGQSGNPTGRPASATRRLRVFDELVTDVALAEAVNALIKAACGGDVQAIKYLLDRVLGPTASLVDLGENHTGADVLALLIAKVKANDAA